MQLPCEAIELVHHTFVVARERVVAQHRRDRDEQAERGHDQRFAHRTGHLVDAGLARGADAHQRVVDAPDGAEQPDEGCGGAHRGQYRQTRLHALGAFVDGAAQAFGKPLGQADLPVQVVAVAAVVVHCCLGFGGHVAEGVGLAVFVQQRHAFGKAVRVPEASHGAAGPA